MRRALRWESSSSCRRSRGCSFDDFGDGDAHSKLVRDEAEVDFGWGVRITWWCGEEAEADDSAQLRVGARKSKVGW